MPAPMMGAAAVLAGAAGASRLLNAWYYALVEMPVGASSRFRYLRQNLPGSLAARQQSSSFWHFSQARRFLRRSAL